MENKNKYLIMLFIFMAIVTIAGTFAWLTYRSKKTALVLTVGSIDGMSVTLKPYQITASLTPTNDYTTEEYVNVTANNKKTKAEIFNLYYEIDTIDAELIDDGFKYTIVKSTDNWSTQTVVKTGDFSSAIAGQNLNIYTETVPGGNTTYQYKVYLWIDSTDGNQANMQGKVFKGELRAEIEEVATPNPPVLDTGMIPVKISNTGVVTAVSEDDDTWYDYSNQEWANAVLVKETGVKSRSANKNDLTTINPSDILAYYVWIPRYSYKIWTLDASSDHTGDEQTIDIKFVNKNTKDAGTSVGDYYTHPAFTFGSQELDGFWVGKFEMSHDTLASSSVSNDLGCTNTTCTNANGLRILPTVSSLRYNSVSNMYYATRSMEQSNNVFGITNSDSHMMKNSEWGAVAYLSHSNYGINTEIRKNNYRKYFGSYYKTSTGCGANVANANTTTIVTTCAIPYGIVSGETFVYPQSTTGNISGIFDMSGGAGEYVMGNYDGTIGSSGFTTMPDSKYYDNYPSSIFTGNYSTNMTFCTLAICGGHALNETRAWYSDVASFVISDRPWFNRGGDAGGNEFTGTFALGNSLGSVNDSLSWRGVLVASGT